MQQDKLKEGKIIGIWKERKEKVRKEERKKKKKDKKKDHKYLMKES